MPLSSVHQIRPHGAAFQSGELYRIYWDACVDGLFAVKVTADGDYRCAGFNAALTAVTGLNCADTAGKTPHEYMDASSANALVSLYDECLAAEAPVSRTQILDLPLGPRIYEVSVVPVAGTSGRIELLLGRAQDITDATRSIGEAQLAQRLLRDVMSALSVHLAVLDRAGGILMVNDAWRDFSRERGSGEDVVGANYLDLCVRAAKAGDTEAAALLKQLELIYDGSARSVSHVYESGEFVFQMRAVRYDRGTDFWVIVTHDDVSAVRRAEHELDTITERLLDVQEEERRRIALELHDTTAQHLTAIRLVLTAVRQGAARDEMLDEMAEELAEAHREIRTLSYLLHPPQLSDEGLASTLQTFVSGFQKRTGLQIELRLEGRLDAMPFQIQRAVFRVIQEALANAHKHANAKCVLVELLRRTEGLSVMVADDGCAWAGDIVPGVGIPGMEARIERFGGRLSVEPSTSGTKVSAFIGAAAFVLPLEFEAPLVVTRQRHPRPRPRGRTLQS